MSKYSSDVVTNSIIVINVHSPPLRYDMMVVAIVIRREKASILLLTVF
jgi:hypothetical protein